MESLDMQLPKSEGDEVPTDLEGVSTALETTQSSALDPANWMARLMPTLSTRSFATICVPRSHDSGTYKVTEEIRLGTVSTVQTQTIDIEQQLLLGFRVFDIRPIIRKGKYFCGHYNWIDKGQIRPWADKLLRVFGQGKFIDDNFGYWSGGAGVSIDDLIDQVNSFTAKHNEAVILELSHPYNFDKEKRHDQESGNFNQQDWQNLLQKLTRLNHRFVQSPGSTTLIKDVKFGDMISGKPAVIMNVPKDRIPDSLAGQGFYGGNHFDGLKDDPNGDLDPIHSQTTTEAIFAYLRDKGYGNKYAFSIAVNLFGSVYNKKGAFSVIEQAVLRQDEVLPRIRREITKDKFPSYVSFDHIRNQEPVKIVHQIY